MKRFNLSVGDRVRWVRDKQPRLGVVTSIVIYEDAHGNLVPMAEIEYDEGTHKRLAVVDITAKLVKKGTIEVLPIAGDNQSRCRFVC